MANRDSHIPYLHLLILGLGLAVPLILFHFRQLDDNRLTSWGWVFAENGPIRFVVIILVALGSAWLVSTLTELERAGPATLFVLSFGAAACFWSEPEVIVDAARYFTQAKHLELHGTGYFVNQWGKSIFAWTDLPLVPLLYGELFRFLGEHRILVQVLNTLLYSGTVLLTYKIGTTLWNETLGKFAGFLLLGFPYLYTQVPLMLVDIASMFFLLLAVYCFTVFLLHGGRTRFWGAAGAILCTVYAKYSLWLYLGVLIVIAGVYLFSRKDKVLSRSLYVFGAVLLTAGSIYLAYHRVMNDQIVLLASYQKSGLSRWGESFVSTFFYQTHPFLTLTVLLSAWAALVRRDAKYLIIGFLVIVIVLLQVKRSRYVMPVFPMLALMSSYGVMQLQSAGARRLLVSCIVLTSFLISLGGYLPFLKRMSARNLQSAGHYLDENSIALAWTVLLPQEDQIVNPEISLPLLDIYTRATLLRLPNQGPETVDPRKTATSSLRFTWEYPLPDYYTKHTGNSEPEALVIIGSTPGQTLPRAVRIFAQKFGHKQVFSTTTGMFTHNTVVTVFR